VGQTAELAASSSNLQDEFAWTSDANAVAVVTSEGVVAGVSEGETVITAVGTESGARGQASITVVLAVDFTATPTSGEAPLVVQFSDMSATGDEPIAAWSWDFGDGTGSEESNPAHTYVNPGTYTIRLTITSSTGEFSEEKADYLGAFETTAVDSVVDDLQGIIVLCSLPDNGLEPDSRESLITKVANAKDAYLSGQPCAPVGFLEAYLDEVQMLRTPANPLFEQLYNLGRMSVYNMIASRGWECAGHLRITADDVAGQQRQVQLAESSSRGLAASISFPEPRLQTVETQRQAFTEIQIPGLPTRPGPAGLPGIPSIRRLVAIPRGGDIKVSVTPNAFESFKANVYPFQPEPVDQRQPDSGGAPPSPRVFADQPFELDDATYATNAFYPERPYNVTRLGQMRGLEIVQIEVFCGQYNPVAQELRLFEDVLLRSAFSPDPTTGRYDFLMDTSTSPFESDPGLYIGAVINSGAVESSTPAAPHIVPPNAGEEFLILTHPNFRQAANALAAWKNEKGILTSVFEVGTGVDGRETNTAILAFIRNHHDTSIVKPSYLLFLGDAEYIEPWYLAYIGKEGETIGTDWPYAREPGTAEIVIDLPRYAMGRIPVDTLAQANDVVNKIIDYEKRPPSAPGSTQYFYDTVTLASQFQCCRQGTSVGTAQRTFTEVSEWVRAGLINRGYTVERIYTRTIDDEGDPDADPPVPPYTDDPTPRRYYTGQTIPMDIGPNSGFAWDGDTQDIIDAWNQGRFLIMHRDHGYSGGFSNPSFTTADAWIDLANAPLLPVVFSVNCASGVFDNETTDDYATSTTYFAEQLLRMNGGAVGVLGDTRNSPSWANTALAMGFFDAIWPSMISGFGDAKSRVRLGDIMNHAKLYLLTQVDMAGAGVSENDALNELYMWHVLGDPTLEIWTENPNPNLLPDDFSFEQGEDSAILTYAADGATVTAYQVDPAGNGFVAIGRAPVVNGRANIEYFQQPLPGVAIILAVSAEDAVSRRLTIEPSVPGFAISGSPSTISGQEGRPQE
jgi:PKD repeat protein